MRVFPQFHPIDNKQFKDTESLRLLIKLSPQELEVERKSFEENNFEYSSLGTPVTGDEIEEIYDEMLKLSYENGYPNTIKDNVKNTVDAGWGKILHQKMSITRNEASKAGIWNALACHYMPNLIAWRWEAPGYPSENPSERWLTQERQYRHSLGRLWWRCEILRNPDKNNLNPYQIVEKLGEDELGQLMERSAFASLPTIPYSIAKLHIDSPNKVLSEDFRKVIKLILLRATIRDLEIMEASGIAEEFIKDCYQTVWASTQIKTPTHKS